MVHFLKIAEFLDFEEKFEYMQQGASVFSLVCDQSRLVKILSPHLQYPPFSPSGRDQISILGRFSAKMDVSVDFGFGNLQNFLILKKNLLNKLSDRLM